MSSQAAIDQCISAAFPLPAAIFVLGALCTMLFLKSRNGLTLVQAVQVFFGVRRIAFGKWGSALMVLTVVVPTALLLLRANQCGSLGA